jgi:hypothetical protein
MMRVLIPGLAVVAISARRRREGGLTRIPAVTALSRISARRRFENGLIRLDTGMAAAPSILTRWHVDGGLIRSIQQLGAPVRIPAVTLLSRFENGLIRSDTGMASAPSILTRCRLQGGLIRSIQRLGAPVRIPAVTLLSRFENELIRSDTGMASAPSILTRCRLQGGLIRSIQQSGAPVRIPAVTLLSRISARRRFENELIRSDAGMAAAPVILTRWRVDGGLIRSFQQSGAPARIPTVTALSRISARRRFENELIRLDEAMAVAPSILTRYRLPGGLTRPAISRVPKNRHTRRRANNTQNFPSPGDHTCLC